MSLLNTSVEGKAFLAPSSSRRNLLDNCDFDVQMADFVSQRLGSHAMVALIAQYMPAAGRLTQPPTDSKSAIMPGRWARIWGNTTRMRLSWPETFVLNWAWVSAYNCGLDRMYRTSCKPCLLSSALRTWQNSALKTECHYDRRSVLPPRPSSATSRSQRAHQELFRISPVTSDSLVWKYCGR